MFKSANCFFTVGIDVHRNIRNSFLEDYKLEVLQVLITSYQIIHDNGGFTKIKLGHKQLAYKFIEQLNDQQEKTFDDKLCVIRYIVNFLSDKYATIDIPTVKKQFADLNIDYEKGVSVEEIDRWPGA